MSDDDIKLAVLIAVLVLVLLGAYALARTVILILSAIGKIIMMSASHKYEQKPQPPPYPPYWPPPPQYQQPPALPYHQPSPTEIELLPQENWRSRRSDN